jgi:hypothetical protein
MSSEEKGSTSLPPFPHHQGGQSTNFRLKKKKVYGGIWDLTLNDSKYHGKIFSSQHCDIVFLGIWPDSVTGSNKSISSFK